MRISGLILWMGFTLTACGPRPQGDMSLAEPTPLYETPSASARILDTLPPGTIAARLSQQGEWTWICLRGLKGWINTRPLTTDLPSEPLPESILAEKRSDTVLADIGIDNEKNTFLRLTDFQPWFVADSSSYAGYYEGLPGEPIALLIMNFAPRLSPILRTTEINAETMEMQESEEILTGDYYLMGNLILANDLSAELPFKRAEFVYYQGRRGLLIERAPGTYVLLWRKEIFS